MTKRILDVDGYWTVIVMFNVDVGSFDLLENELRCCGCDDNSVNDIYYGLLADVTAFTFSNVFERVSIIGFKTFKSRTGRYDNVVHEAEHVKQVILGFYDVDDKDEPPAYTIGFLAREILRLSDNV